MTNSIWKFFTSLRLTVFLLGLGTLLVFLGTVAQVHEGLWNAQTRWFRHLLVVREAGDPWWVPPIYPGGYLIGILLVLNLAAAHIKRFHLTWRQFGINLTHLGVIVLLVGQLATDMLSRESVMSFREGETRQFSEATRQWELVFLRAIEGEKEEVVAIPESLLKDGTELRDEKLPFAVKVKTYWQNSEPSFRAPMQQNGPALTEHGLGKDWDFHALPEAKGMDDRNNPTVIVELGPRLDRHTSIVAQPLGTWVVPSWAGDPMLIAGVKSAYTRSVGKEVAESIATKLGTPQIIEVGGQKWRMVMRPERYYKPFTVKLLKTTHDVYPGTATAMNPEGIPKDFRSRVQIDNPATGEKREVEIWMNNPLRYQGLTFYQSTMGKDEMKDVGRSGLQVVRNPSWLTPYAGCLIVALGMCWQFLAHLIGFIRKRQGVAA